MAEVRPISARSGNWSASSTTARRRHHGEILESYCGCRADVAQRFISSKIFSSAPAHRIATALCLRAQAQGAVNRTDGFSLSKAFAGEESQYGCSRWQLWRCSIRRFAALSNGVLDGRC
jgi:hypothetical protein